jgi:primosomal protein N'
VCVSCGRTAFTVPRGGVSHLVSQVQKSTGRPVVEVTAETDDSWTPGSVFIGTEAVLFRMTQAETVVFADIDRDLNAPRVTAAREVASLLVRAARVVGADGRVVVQTRTPRHPLLVAISSGDTTEPLLEWNRADVATRESFGLPPFGVMARIALADGRSFSELPNLAPVRIAVRGDEALLSAESRDAMREAVSALRQTYGTSVRVHADPTRY